MPTIRADATDDLFRAAQGGTVSEVRTALSAGAIPGVRDIYGATPLFYAALKTSNLVVIAALIEAGADPGTHDEIGATPLHAAALGSSNPAVIMALIEAGADPSARDIYGYTPFDYTNGNTPYDPSIFPDYAKGNEALRGTDAYWQLNEARFE